MVTQMRDVTSREREAGAGTPPGARVDAVTGVYPVADPAPLGLAAFGATLLVLGLVTISDPDAKPLVVLPLAVFYGGLAQLLAGMWEFKRPDVFAATALSSYGAFWLSFAGFNSIISPELGGPATEAAGNAKGIFFLAWAIFTIIMLITSLRVSTHIALLFTLLAITFFAFSFHGYTGYDDAAKVGGYCAIATGLGCLHISFLATMRATWGRDEAHDALTSFVFTVAQLAAGPEPPVAAGSPKVRALLRTVLPESPPQTPQSRVP